MKAVSHIAARLSLAAALMFLCILTALHILKPELDPSWRFISEYAIGDYGWAMMLAFFSLATSYVMLVVSIGSRVKSIAGRIGLALLLLSAVGMIIAGIFTSDPITSNDDAATSSGELHQLGAMFDVTPFAALLINLSLARGSQARSSERRLLFWTAWLPLIGLVGFIGALVVMSPSDGKFGPDVPVGWPNRFMIVTYCAWVITVAWHAILSGSRSS